MVNTVDKKHWLKRIGIFTLKYVIAPLITGFIVWIVTKNIDSAKISGLNENITSLDNTIQSLKDTIQIKESLINNYKIELEKGNIFIGSDIKSRDIIGSIEEKK